MILEIKNLSHSFGGLKAVSNFNLKVEKGSIVGVIGPNGAGKTTVFNLISGIYRPREGQVRLEGTNLVGLPLHAIAARGISRTFQNLKLFPALTVLENVRVALLHRTHPGFWEAVRRVVTIQDAKVTAQEAMSFLERVGLAGRAGEQAGALPYGLQRRLELARALATGPKVLLLDEPAAGMNPSEVTGLTDLVRKLREEFDLTVVLIEHQMQMVNDLCERVTVMDFGETIAEGTPGEIQRNPHVVEAYLGEEVAV
ncbi:MAG: ABC transporter ATP-binding protein [Actinobacteria bacterium]|nr:ABC transporter ATP-binding protein [Actinomycetota bacterium]